MGDVGLAAAAAAEAATEATTTMTTYKWEHRNTSAHFYPRHQLSVNGLVKISDTYYRASLIFTYINENWDVNKVQ
jgi:hypothetical protein